MGGVGRAKKAVSPGLRLWWSKHKPVNGMVVEHISPYQQKVFSGMFRNVGTKSVRRITDNVDVIAVGVATYGLVEWVKFDYEKRLRAEWP